MMKKRALRLVLVVLAAVAATGGSLRAAEGVGAWFDLGASATSLGVGGARAAFRDGPDSVSLNPASLARVERLGLTTMYVNAFGAATHGAMAASAPYVGFAASLIDSGLVPADVADLRFAQQGIAAAAALPIGPVAVGARWRFVHSSAPVAGAGWAADVGVLVEFEAWRVGAICDAVVSGPLEYEGGARETWQRDLCVGGAWTVSILDEMVWTLTLDVDRIFAGPWRVVGGIEAAVGALAARLGWDGDGVTLGLGVRVAGIGFDWSCAVRSDLGASHRVSLGVAF